APLTVLEPADDEDGGRRRSAAARTVRCPSCNTSFTAGANAGRELACPSCGMKIVGVHIPEAAAPPEGETHRSVDTIAIVTAAVPAQRRPPLAPGEIIAPAVGNDAGDPTYHNNSQAPEAFLRAGGRRGRQYVPLTDGTYFINRWLASIEVIPKTVVPIGYVGV